jgi:hypothetical protein
MESRKKAKKLFDKYYLLLTYFSENSSIDSRRIYAKQCALIAVDEILNQCLDYRDIDLCRSYNYWQEVKQELMELL